MAAMKRLQAVAQHVSAGAVAEDDGDSSLSEEALRVFSGHAARHVADTQEFKRFADAGYHATLDAMADALSGNHSSLEPGRDYLADFSPVERLLRIELAAAYRWIAKMGWSDTINNHISMKIPGSDHFLLNPYGVGYEEMTASGLVKIDIDGNVVHPGFADLDYARGHVNKAGFIIHSAVHAARHDLMCVLHTHDPNVVAVSDSPDGLLPVGQAFFGLGQITYHNYEGIAVSPSERETLVADLGKRSSVMLLRNHGCLVAGRSIAECMTKTYYLHKCCEMQVKAATCAAAAGSKMILPTTDVRKTAGRQSASFDTEDGQGEASKRSDVLAKEWVFHLRMMFRNDPGFVR